MKTTLYPLFTSPRSTWLGAYFLAGVLSSGVAQSQILKLKGPEDKVFSQGKSLIFQCDPRLLDCQKDLVTLQQVATKYPTIKFWHVHSKLQNKNLKRTKNFDYALPTQGGAFAITDKLAYHDEANYSLISFIMNNKFETRNLKIGILRIDTERLTEQLDPFVKWKGN